MEMGILDWIQSIRTPIGDAVIPLITKLGNGGMIWILLSVILLLIPKTRKSGAILAAALCVDGILCNGILKNLFGRIRPCDVNTSVALLIPRPADFSFPSGHTAASFAAVTALYLGGRRVKERYLSALVLAVLISFSRLYLYVHYPSDILGGIFVGIFAGYAGYWMVNRVLRRKENRKPMALQEKG